MNRAGSSGLHFTMVLALFACASQPRVADEQPSTPMAGCPGRSAAPDGATWQEVNADGFSFCVPLDWRPGGRNSWEGDGGSVTWGRGEPRETPVATLPGQEPTDVWRVSESIGGAPARLGRFRSGSTYRTSAMWQTPRVYFFGETARLTSAKRHIEIYRTVRFAPSTSER